MKIYGVLNSSYRWIVRCDNEDDARKCFESESDAVYLIRFEWTENIEEPVRYDILAEKDDLVSNPARGKSRVASVIFKKNDWSFSLARHWVVAHNYRVFRPWDSRNEWHFPQTEKRFRRYGRMTIISRTFGKPVYLLIGGA